MKQLLLTLLYVAISSAQQASACEAYWTSINREPELVVVGTLSDVTRDALYIEGFPSSVTDSIILNFFDSGWIEVDRVLHGDRSVERVPVVWFARSRFEPPIEGRSVMGSGNEFHDVGERHIWVLWEAGRFAEPYSKHREFQELPIEMLDQVIVELNEMRTN